MDDHTTDMSLSFVDVIANGLGSLLVLFFLMATLQGGLHWSTRTNSDAGQTNDPSDPFVLLVAANNEKPLVAGGATPWLVGGAQGGFSYTESYGPGYAVLYADRVPPLGTTVHLRLDPQAMPADARVQVFRAGRQTVGRLERPVDRLVRVWPLAELGDEK